MQVESVLTPQGSGVLLCQTSGCAQLAAAPQRSTSGSRGMLGPCGSRAGQLQSGLPVLYMTSTPVSQSLGKAGRQVGAADAD